MSESSDDKSDKTEPASEKKIQDALEKGQVPFSRELPAALGVCAIGGIIYLLLPTLAGRLADSLNASLSDPAKYKLETADDALLVFWSAASAVGGVLVAIIIILILSGLVASFVQVPPQLVSNRITPKLSHISIQQGFKRIVSLHGLVELLKAIAKMTAIFFAAYIAVGQSLTPLTGALYLDPTALPLHLQSFALRFVAFVGAVVAIVAFADLVWTRVSWHRNLRMSRQELKDEFKQAEGDQMLKARQRSLARSRLHRTMLANVKQASFVVANPTHYAVALYYSRESGGSPKVLAKGMDLVALRIRGIAEEAGVPVIENKLLAKTLHDSVEIDRYIPPEFYRAVAEIVLFLQRR